MEKKEKENELCPLERLRLATPKLPGERPGAFGRRIMANFKAISQFEKRQLKALELKNYVAPTSFVGKLIEKVIIKPIQFVEKMFNKVVDFITVPYVAEGTAEFVYLNEEDERTGCNKFLKVTNFDGVVVLMSSMTVVKTLTAALKWKNRKLDKVAQGNEILDKAAVSTYVSILPATITAARTLVTNYANSTPATEESTFFLLNSGMKSIMRLFQNASELSPINSLAIITSGGFSVKVITPRGPQEWKVIPSPVQGTLILTAAGASRGNIHDWWISYDGVTFHRLEPTIHADTMVTGLAPNINVYFLHQVINTNGGQGFDETIKITVPA